VKCAACGYEHRLGESIRYEKVTRYQSGKRKGEVKSIDWDVLEIPGNEPFREIRIPDPGFLIESNDAYNFSKTRQCCLYACPECLTVRVEPTYW